MSSKTNPRVQLPISKWTEWLFYTFRSKHTIIIEVDLEGKIISSAHDPEGHLVQEVTEVTDVGDYLYLGSYYAKRIARLHKKYLLPNQV